MHRDLFATESPFTALRRAQRQRFVVALSRAAIATTIFLAGLYSILYLFRPSWELAFSGGQGVVTLSISLLAHRLAKRGKAELASYILLPYLLLITGALSVILGLLPVIAPVYMAFIVVAGMVWGPIGGYGIAGVAAILWLAAYFMVGIGLSPPSPLTDRTVTLVTVVLTQVSFFFVAYVSQAATSGLWRALDDAAFDVIDANRQLEEANRHKSQFVARMSHDLRSPLNAIMLSTDLTRRSMYGPVTEKQQEALDRVLNSANRLQILIEDILDISKLEAGQLELVAEAFEVQSLVETVETTLGSNARDKGLAFSIDIGEGMPSRIVGDENRLTQILVNLTDNAIKYTEEGEVRALIEPSGNGCWRMVVRDTGRGIHENDLDIIFEEFRRAEAASASSVGGTGLGLAITRHLVEMMDGTIHVTSKIGKGSTFEVELPLVAADDTPA